MTVPKEQFYCLFRLLPWAWIVVRDPFLTNMTIEGMKITFNILSASNPLNTVLINWDFSSTHLGLAEQTYPSLVFHAFRQLQGTPIQLFDNPACLTYMMIAPFTGLFKVLPFHRFLRPKLCWTRSTYWSPYPVSWELLCPNRRLSRCGENFGKLIFSHTRIINS